MKSLVIELFYLTIIVVFIVDLSGLIDTLKEFIFRFTHGTKIPYKNFNMRPFDCSLCATWWAGILYLLTFYSFSIQSVLICALCAFMAEVIGECIMMIRDLISKFIDFVYKKIE